MRHAARPGEPDQASQLEGVVGDREQVGRSADPHRREPGERLVADVLTPRRRWMSVPIGDGVEGGGGHRGSPRHAARPPERRSMTAGSGKGSRARGGQHELGDGLGGAGPAQAARRGRHGEVGRRVVEDARRLEQGVGVEVLVLDESGGPASIEDPGVGALVAAGMGIRDDDHRQARAVTSASVDEPARPTTRSAAASADSISSRRNGYGR